MAARKQPGAARATPQKAGKILDILEETHPDARIYLDFETPLQLLVATMLAAQCTDERVNGVTPELFERYPTAADLAAARPSELEELIRSTGFFRQKARSIRACCKVIAEQYHGEVPPEREALTQIRGVGRKTANVVLANAFGQPAIAVDTHVSRVSTRLSLAEGKNPDKIERQLCELIPEERWTRATQLLGTHGRRICTAKKPDHEGCPVNKLCDFYQEMISG
ncbi:MAG: endonuclease III [Planctomycetota bacterium]|jgi:endonuclease-3